MSQSKRFSYSFKPIVKPKPKHSFKEHFSGSLRELVGLLEYLASIDPEGERFVYAGVPWLVSHCKKFKSKGKDVKDKDPYSRRSIEYALAEFRRRHVIGPLHKRERNGVQVNGFIVALHDALFSTHDGLCFWHEFHPKSAGASAGVSAGVSAEQSAGVSAVAVSAQADDE